MKLAHYRAGLSGCCVPAASPGGEFPLCVEVLLLEAHGWLSYKISFSILQICLLLQSHDLNLGLHRMVCGAQVQVRLAVFVALV